MLELVLVLVILAIAAASASTRIVPDGEYTSRYQAERLAAHLRHAQSLAMRWQERLRVTTAAGNYQITCVNGSGASPCVNAGDVVRDPYISESMNITVEDNVTLSGTPATTLDFDSLGRPLDGAGNLTTAVQDFRLTSPGGVVWSVTVEPVTGFVGVARL